MFILTISRKWVMQKLAILVTFVLLAGLTTLYGRQSLLAVAVPDTEKPLVRADSPDDRVALTFDVTWQANELKKIQAVLDRENVKATFFVGGTFLSAHPDVVRELVSGGHEIGTLGQRIVNLSELPEQTVTSNLLASQSALSKILGGPVRYFRPPQGEATPAIVRAAKSADLTTVMASLDSEDHLRRPATEIANRVVRGARRGDIIRLSASDFSPETAKALPAIISGLKGRGFKLVRLSDLVPSTP